MIQLACDEQALGVLLALLGYIHGEEGYYLNWNYEVCFSVAYKCRTTQEMVQKVVQVALAVGFFNMTIFEQFGVLTSRGIQNRFIAATIKRKEVQLQAEYLVVEPPKRKNISVIFGLGGEVSPETLKCSEFVNMSGEIY